MKVIILCGGKGLRMQGNFRGHSQTISSSSRKASPLAYNELV